MSTLYITLLTLIVYSTIATVIYILSGENEDILLLFGLGIIGLLLIGLYNIT